MYMLISSTISDNELGKHKFINEKEIDKLALVDSKIDGNLCVFLDSEKYISRITKKTVMVITTDYLGDKVVTNTRGAIVVDDPKISFFSLHNYLSEQDGYKREKFETIIDENSKISSSAYISKENVHIGKNVVIEPFVTIYPNVVIGDNTIISAGATIGGCGFEFKRNGKKILSVKHVGGVVVGENVEIQNNSCIDRAIYPWDNTIIGDCTKIDNLVHIGHAAKIGKGVLIAGQALVSGRVEIGDNTWVGVGAIIRNGIYIGENARVNIGAVVSKNVVNNGNVTGNFAIEHERFIRHIKEISR